MGMNRMTRIALTAAGAVLLAGCGDTTGGAPASAPTPTTRPASGPGGEPTLAGADPNAGRCTASHAGGEIPQGGRMDERTFQAWIAMTNTGSGSCTLEGSSELKILTGGTGTELEIKQVLGGDAPATKLTVKPGETALMTVEFSTAPAGAVPPDCLEGGTFVRYTLPGDTMQIEARADPALEVFPPICSAVTVTPWWKHPTG